MVLLLHCWLVLRVLLLLLLIAKVGAVDVMASVEHGGAADSSGTVGADCLLCRMVALLRVRVCFVDAADVTAAADAAAAAASADVSSGAGGGRPAGNTTAVHS